MEKRPKTDLTERKSNAASHEAARDATAAIAGALVGIAIGGVPGAVAGAAFSPLLVGVTKVVSDALQRRRLRAEAVFELAITRKGLSPEQTVNLLETEPEKVDAILNLLKQAADASPDMTPFLASVLGELMVSEQGGQRERLLLLTDAVLGLRSTHLRILKELYSAGGACTASDLASKIEIPEIELRNVVRELELRGMIKDMRKHPIEWRLRELGHSLVSFVDSLQKGQTS